MWDVTIGMTILLIDAYPQCFQKRAGSNFGYSFGYSIAIIHSGYQIDVFRKLPRFRARNLTAD